MTSVEEIRRAATLMRAQALAEAALREGDPYYNPIRLADGTLLTELSAFQLAWRPPVAIEVAEWLSGVAKRLAHRAPYAGAMGEEPVSLAEKAAALAVARAYLGGAT